MAPDGFRRAMAPWAAAARRLALFAAAAYLLLTHYVGRLPSELTQPDNRIWMRDFFVYYDAGVAVRHGGPLYVQTLPPGQGQPMIWRTGGYFYPPAFAVALSPLARLPFRQAWWIWRGVCELALLGGIACLVTLARGRFRTSALLVWLLAAIAQPITWRTLRLGQLDALLLLLISGGMLAAAWGRDLRAGSSLGAAAACKLHPGVLVVYFCLRRRWRVVAAALLFFVAANSLAIWIAGWEAHWIYLTQVLPLLNEATVQVDNVSFYAVAGQFLIHSGYAAPGDPAPLALRLLHLVYALLVAGLVLWCWRGADWHTPHQSAVALAAGVIGAVLISKFCWTIYLLLLLIPGVLLWEWAPGLADRRALWLRAGLVGIWLALYAGTRLLFSTPLGVPYTSVLPLAAAWAMFALTLWGAERAGDELWRSRSRERAKAWRKRMRGQR
jgi:alpha-1,2-mannosyltransferase